MGIIFLIIEIIVAIYGILHGYYEIPVLVLMASILGYQFAKQKKVLKLSIIINGIIIGIYALLWAIVIILCLFNPDFNLIQF